MSQLVFSIGWNSKDVDSNASGGMDLLGQEWAGRARRSFLLPWLLHRLPAEGAAQVSGRSSHFRTYALNCIFPLLEELGWKWRIHTSNDLIKKLGVPSCLGFLVNSRCGQAEDQKWSHHSVNVYVDRLESPRRWSSGHISGGSYLSLRPAHFGGIIP